MAYELQNVIVDRYAVALQKLSELSEIVPLIYQHLKELISLVNQASEKDAALSSANKPIDLLEAPFLKVQQKKELIDFIFSVTDWHSLLKNYLYLIIENGRVNYLAAILRQSLLFLEQSLYTSVTLTVAKPLEESELHSWQQLLSEKIGALSSLTKHTEENFSKPINLVVITDKQLIDGFKIEFGSFLFDASLQSRLNNLYSIVKGKQQL